MHNQKYPHIKEVISVFIVNRKNQILIENIKII